MENYKIDTHKDKERRKLMPNKAQANDDGTTTAKAEVEDEQDRWYNLHSKVIYYRHYKFKLDEQTTLADVQMVANWIERGVPHDHAEYPLLQRLIELKLREFDS